MANYTSTYTGAQIDAAITKVNSITSTPAQVDATVTRLGQVASTPNQIDTVVSKVNGINYTAAQINNGVANGLNVAALIAQAKLAIYPVGSIYMSTASTDPKDIIGGRWEAIQGGRFLIAANSTYTPASTGGEAQVTLSANTIPSHNHNVNGMQRSAGLTTDTYLTMQNDGNLVTYSVKGGEWHATWAASWMSSPYMNIDATAGSHYYDWIIGAGDWGTSWTGGSQPHNNIPPYYAVYMWRRVE